MKTNKIAVVAASAVAVAGGAAVLVAPAAATAKPAHKPVVRNCAGKGVVAPRDYTLYCGDGNDALLKLHWKHWGAAATTTTGKIDINNCKPNCAAGKDKIYPVTVKLSDLKHSAYSRITLHFTGKVPAGTHRTDSYKVGAHGPVM